MLTMQTQVAPVFLQGPSSWTPAPLSAQCSVNKQHLLDYSPNDTSGAITKSLAHNNIHIYTHMIRLSWSMNIKTEYTKYFDTSPL